MKRNRKSSSKKAIKEKMKKLRERMQKSASGRENRGGTGKNLLNFSKGKAKGKNKKIPIFEVQSGKNLNVIEILPFMISAEWYKKLKKFTGEPTGFEKGDVDYKLEIPIHFGIGEENKPVLCLKEAFGQKCAICDEKDKAWKAENEDKARALTAKWRVYYNIFNHNEPEKGIQIWDSSYHLFEKLFLEEAEFSAEDGVVPFADIFDGRTVQFRGRKKSYNNRSFVEASHIKFLERDEDYDEGILEKTYGLDKMLEIPTSEEVEKLFNDTVEVDDDEDEEYEPEDEEDGDEPPWEDEENEEGDNDEEECPVEFGKDFDKFEECNDCDDDLKKDCKREYLKRKKMNKKRRRK